LFFDRQTKATRGFPGNLRWEAQRKLQYLNAAAQLSDLAAALRTSPELWLNLQMQWDLSRAEAKRKRAS
jgi:hypothetical protein